MLKWLPLLLVLVPSVVFACPVCGNAPERSRAAYTMMTVVMSLLPLGVIGGLGYVFAQRLRKADAADDKARAEGRAAARDA